MSGFIAIEGGDGSGKRTQAEIFYRYAVDELKKNVLKMSFPRYSEPSAFYAKQYLNGIYGSAEDVHPELGILPFALDRYAASPEIRQHLALPNSLVISDRFMASNLAHQGAKIADAGERKSFYEKTMHTEYEILNIPRPMKNIVLLVPTHIAQANIDRKDPATRTYTEQQRDIHEADASHLEMAKANYEELCRLYPDEFVSINCVDASGNMRSVDSIQDEIRQLLG